MPEFDDHAPATAGLREEIGQLKTALASRAVIDQAIGVVVAYGGVGPDQGWEVLTDISQHTNVKLREVAAHLLLWPQSTSLPPEIRSALDAALERQKTEGPGTPLPPEDGSSPV